MKDDNNIGAGLWPIIEVNEDWSPMAWAILNAGALLAVATPFLMALGLLSCGLWMANGMQSLLLDWLGAHTQVVTNATYALKLCMVAFVARMLWMMVPFIPHLIEGARAVVRDET